MVGLAKLQYYQKREKGVEENLAALFPLPFSQILASKHLFILYSG